MGLQKFKTPGDEPGILYGRPGMKGVLQVDKQPCQLFCVWPILALCIKRCAFTGG